MKPFATDYLASLSEEVAKLDCTTEESKAFRNIALRLIELHQHQAVSIVMAVLMMRDRNRLLNHVSTVLHDAASDIEASEDYYENDENSRKLNRARTKILDVLRLVRREI